MTYHERKEQQQCTRDTSCPNPPDVTGECALHRSQSCDRKRYWWTYRRFHRRPKQLELVFNG